MYRMNITKGKLGDLLALLLYEKMKNDEFVSESEMLNELIDVMKTKGLRPKLHSFFFDVEGNFRSRFRQMVKMLEKDRDVAINIWFDEDEPKNEEVEYRQIIEACVKKLTKKENPNPEKLEEFINEVINELE